MTTATLIAARPSARVTEANKIALELARAALLFGLATIGFLGLVAALFAVGAFSSVSILFYRCIAITALATVLFGAAFAVVGHRFNFAGVRDAFAATLVAASLTFTFLTLGPVTVDRSISIFINGHMAAQPDRVFSAAEIDRAFRDRYLTGMDQIARRMEEQRITGTVERIGTGYRITAKGKALIATSRTMADLFGADNRLLDGPKASMVDSHRRQSHGCRRHRLPRVRHDRSWHPLAQGPRMTPSIGTTTSLDRQGLRRSDTAYLESLQQRDDVRFLILADQKPVIRSNAERTDVGIRWLTRAELASCDMPIHEPLFLGVDKATGAGRFALAVHGASHTQCAEGARYAAPDRGPAHAGDAGRDAGGRPLSRWTSQGADALARELPLLWSLRRGDDVQRWRLEADLLGLRARAFPTHRSGGHHARCR